ncbi:hypothetical protein ACDW_37100 [Acidovorax sp. DW039]|uniref:hypothetical protein n=1 Tax=Acidovorax sp. DW039 TaxID=3095606 RepID=UPI00308C946C|nr:hypothetical protein ACDW_37100 [Acidovorax sp. DW039]
MSLEEALVFVETKIEKVSAALLTMDAAALETASTELRDAAARFTWALEQAPQASALPSKLQERLTTIGNQLALQREGLARVAALTDRQVAAVVPQASSAGSATYGNPQAGSGVAGNVARIYRSAG